MVSKKQNQVKKIEREQEKNAGFISRVVSLDGAGNQTKGNPRLQKNPHQIPQELSTKGNRGEGVEI